MQQVNEMALHLFECGDSVDEPMELMHQLILPCLNMLVSGAEPCGDTAHDDQCITEDIRDKWCKFLSEENMPSES